MQNKKRPTAEYSSYQIYPEIKLVNGLEGERLLTFGMIYNFTSRNTTSFLLGKNVNGITKAFNSNLEDFGITKKMTRTTIKANINQLVEDGWLDKSASYIERTEYKGRVQSKELTPIHISAFGMSKIKEARQAINNPQPVNSLF